MKELIKRDILKCYDSLESIKYLLEEEKLYINKEMINHIYEIGNKSLEIVQSELDEIGLLTYEENRMKTESWWKFVLNLRSLIEQTYASRASPDSQSILMNGRTAVGNHFYDRDGSYIICRAEDELLEIIEFDSSRYSLKLTSSGMAAFNLILTTLSSYILNTESLIMATPKIWWEADERLRALNIYNFKRFSSFKHDKILNEVIEERPTIVFMDPLTNFKEMYSTDILSFLENLNILINWEIYIVIDGTMVSGTLNPYIFENQYINIIYYESIIKYLEWGLDIVQAGFVVIPKKFDEMFNKIRGFTGTILYEQNACLLPHIERKNHLKRMHQLSKNALTFTEYIHSSKKLQGLINVSYPGHIKHDYYQDTKNLFCAGGVVCMWFKQNNLNNIDFLNEIIQLIIEEAANNNIYIVHGQSYGFFIPRISQIPAWRDSEVPFIRIVFGDTLHEFTLKFAAFVEELIFKELKKRGLISKKDTEIDYSNYECKGNVMVRIE